MSTPLIELTSVRLQYANGTVALESTDLSIDQGDFVALVGPSGCGKSTILKLVAGLLRPSAGAVVVGGREVGAAGQRDAFASGIRLGLAFQNPTMLPWLSIRENVMIPLKIVEPFRQDYARKKKGEFADRADALLAQVGLKGFADKRPWQLSGGMLQRASLCRALIHEPQLLLLDEPFAGMNTTETQRAANMVRRIRDAGITVVLVEHDVPSVMRICDRIVVLDQGSKIAEGTPQEVRAHERVIQAYLGVEDDA
jgi:NitT/TauT family transport system ATP-binding protein